MLGRAGKMGWEGEKGGVVRSGRVAWEGREGWKGVGVKRGGLVRGARVALGACRERNG